MANDIPAKDVAALRKITGAGMMDCKAALKANDGDMERAKDWLREKGLAGAAKRAGREADQGSVEVLVEGTDKKGLGTQARTRTNRIVHMRDPLEPGGFVFARITEAAAHHLIGVLEPAGDRVAV